MSPSSPPHASSASPADAPERPQGFSLARRRAMYAGVHSVVQGAEQALWAEVFETPDGAPLPMQAFQGKPLLLNFWATWCPPCVAELPLLNRFYQEQAGKGWQVVGLAVDQPSAVRSFLGRAPVDFPVGMAGLGGTDLARSLGNLTGGLPFTALFGADGQVLHRKMGQISTQDLQSWTALH